MRIIDRKDTTIEFPSEREFIETKKISDRIYAWILLNGYFERERVYLNKSTSSRRIYSELGIAKNTYKSKLKNLLDSGYLKEDESRYWIEISSFKYKRYISRETLSKLLELKQEGIIKVYLYLSSLSGVYGDSAFFRYRTILREIGDYSERLSNKQVTKVKNMLDSLVSCGLLEYSRRFSDFAYGVEYKIDWIKE